MNLEDLGWNPSGPQVLALGSDPRRRPGRILRIEGAHASVWTAQGPHTVHILSRLRRGRSTLVVGDWVAIETLEDGTARAVELLPRRTTLARRAAGRRVQRQLIAANVDHVFIVSAMDDEFSPRRLERYVILAHDGGAEPTIVLTKAGLAAAPASFVQRARQAAPGVEVLAIDVLAGIGIDAIQSRLRPGATVVLVGSSGVGKSTLLNHLLPATGTKVSTGRVRAHDGQGQHTTTRRELFVLRGGAIAIDTPGLRELALWADADALDQAFGDIDALARGCRFHDCTHEHEPSCAVLDAVAAGTLDEDRRRSYLDLRRELAATASQKPAHERRRADRKLGRIYRQAQAHKRGRR